MKPKVYIETSIPSYLTARPSHDIRAMANQQITIEWWECSQEKFDLYISELVLNEAAQGNPEAATRRLAVLKEIAEIDASIDADKLAKILLKKAALPEKAKIDASHIAIATINAMDYLLTWNCKHIANAVMRPKIEDICRDYGYQLPIICTPQQLMEN